MVSILYPNNNIIFSNSWACIHILLNKLYRFCTSSSLEVNLSKTKIAIFGCNKRELNQEVFHLDKDQIEITLEYKYLEIDLDWRGYFEPSSKSEQSHVWKPLWTLWGRSCSWSHMLGTQIPYIQGFGASYFHIWHRLLEGDLGNSFEKDFEKGMKMHMMSHVKVCSTTTYHILLHRFGELPIYGLSIMLSPPILLLGSQYSNVTFPTPSQTRI